MNRFILIFPNSTAEQQAKLRIAFPPARAAWWHWSTDVWLLSFGTEPQALLDLRDEMTRLLPGINFLLFGIPPGAPWTGWGPLRWQTWFDKYWNK